MNAGNQEVAELQTQIKYLRESKESYKEQAN